MRTTNPHGGKPSHLVRLARFAGLSLSLSLFCACAQSTSNNNPTSGSDQPDVAAQTTATASAAQAPLAAASEAPTALASTAPTAAPSSGDFTLDPPASGIAMNNAGPPPTAGPPRDRLVGIMNIVQAHREAFRRCFDAWGLAHPGEEASVLFDLHIDGEGNLIDAAINAAESNVKDESIASCAANVAKTLKFPASPLSRETFYSQRFKFRARSTASQ